ncbi:hypothetical protein ILUMI_19479 [Ignelater luminosus]|uniref:Phospholipase A2-like domain-containing protein n=1 Tax=Ignelater luminosus TaxID=2038154 RepID=A0A8K0G5G2_IGNLU|nr:hypothetical protein ILUMI_19479 [Ignelater luminosus]
MAARDRVKLGRGLVNSLINNLPVELHIPGYNYCGPGTKLQERLQRGDPGVNPLNHFCKLHDIAYSQYKDLENRHRADKVLEDAAWQRVKSRNSSLGEKVAALAVTGVMKAKRKLCMGIKKRCNKKRNTGKRKALPFKGGFLKKLINVTKTHSGKDKDLIKQAIGAAKRIIKDAGGKKKIRLPRIIEIPKRGGVLPLIPIFAGLSALGALAGGATSIAKTVSEVKNAQNQFAEAARHNRTMEAIAMGKKKSGGTLYLKPHKKGGTALYLKPYKSKN